MREITESVLLEALHRSWSKRSSTLWTEENPALGNCGVTALVVHDYLGGEILKTRFGEIWHFYNRIKGERIDFTESQFESPITYDDITSSRDEAFLDTNADQYEYLASALRSVLDAA